MTSTRLPPQRTQATHFCDCVVLVDGQVGSGVEEKLDIVAAQRVSAARQFWRCCHGNIVQAFGLLWGSAALTALAQQPCHTCELAGAFSCDGKRTSQYSA